ncbi:MAG: HAMP domain-containing histidine kinase [Sulfurimonas sp.]|nr:HAMP domain-containing histidine kinase [Sulfurimonas sp.]
MYKSEKKTIFNVLAIYLSSTLLLIATLFTSYYFYQQEQLIHNEKEILKTHSLELEDELLTLHQDSTENYKYPRFKNFKSAIYDVDKELIFSTLHEDVKSLDTEFFINNDKSYYILPIKPYYLGAAYMVIEKDTTPVDFLSDLIAIAIVVVLITIFTSLFLVKLVLKPLRENLHLLDNFIKDTTHELNTPITTILANIETLDTKNCDEKSLRKFQRIKIASLNISNLYQDLVYLLLNHKASFKNEDLNISNILNERVQYFTIMANAKKLAFDLNIQDDVVFYADKNKYERLIDNILSNSIKYTKKSTTITVNLTSSTLSMTDEGKGMTQNEIDSIYEKYRRFDNIQGGFGIGYSIIKSIADEYKIKIIIDSEINKGTKVTLKW